MQFIPRSGAAKGVKMLNRRFRMSVIVGSGLFLLATTGLLMASPQNSQNSATDDNAITTAIQAKLFQDPALKTQDIQVSTQNGVVKLTGTVDTSDEQSAVDRIASLEPGVKKVIDSLSVSGPAAVNSSADPNENPPAETADNPSNEPVDGSSADAQDAAPAPVQAPSQPASQAQYFGSAPQQQAVPANLTLPAGTLLSVRVMQALSSDHNQAGDGFTATIAQPVVSNGWVVARRGQTVEGQVAVAKKGGRVKGVSELGVNLTELTLVNGQQLPIRTTLLQTSAGASKGRDVAAVGTTTGIGAMIGAIAGGGEGAAIGAGAGAAASLAGVLLTRGQQTYIPPETLMTFRLESPVNISTVSGQAAFRPVTQQDYPQNALQQRPDRVYVNARPYYGPPAYWGYYGGPGYYPFYWGFGPGWGYWGGGFRGGYRFRGGYHGGYRR